MSKDHGYVWPEVSLDIETYPVRTELTVIPGDTKEPCPVCGEDMWNGCVTAHCAAKGDADHLALDLMST